jgi:toxin ParE1/3/4
MLVERPYLVFYRAVPDVDEEAVQFVEVVRVIDGRRDLKNLI